MTSAQELAGGSLPPSSSSSRCVPVARRHSMLYNGTSDRTRGWKSRRSSYATEGRIPNKQTNVKRWDGAAKACAPWNSLSKDPELWFKEGNCFVHLHDRSQALLGPSFRVPFAALLDAGCQPFINRYFHHGVAEISGPENDHVSDNTGSGIDAVGKIELFIPAPPTADQEQALHFHLAIRNFFAWVFRRSMVGEYLGTALIELVNSMSELRSPGTNNFEDLMSYLDEEGYLDISKRPIHALAMLRLSEHFQWKNLYIDAYAHCVGMNDLLYTYPEYQSLTSVTRRLIWRGRTEMDLTLSQAALALRTFLEDDLSEANFGLSSGGRAHLDRFRTFLLAFYTASLGYYPPEPVDPKSTMWDPEVYQKMRADFEALYTYLADEAITASSSIPIHAQGGICVLQNVNAFDVRHNYAPMAHPLPLLPEISAKDSPKKGIWPVKGNKLSPDHRLVAHAALIKATNMKDPEIMRNSLVSAYRRFEEDSACVPNKIDRHEKLSQADARKIRWILIYAIFQTLLQCTNAPPEVRDTTTVNYSLAVPTDQLPPWKDTQRRPLLAPDTTESRRKSSHTLPPLLIPSLPSSAQTSPVTHSSLQPDIDYLAAATRNNAEQASMPSTTAFRDTSRPSLGLGRRFSRNHMRSSLTLSLTPSSHTMASHASALDKHARRGSFQQILVHGYGNGTNPVAVSEGSDGHSLASLHIDATLPMASRSLSSSSDSSSALSDRSSAGDKSEASTADTSITSTALPSPADHNSGSKTSATSASTRREQAGLPAAAHTLSSASILSETSNYSADGGDDLPPPTRPPAVPQRSSRRKTPDLSRLNPSMLPPALHIAKRASVAAPAEAADDSGDADRWRAIEAAVDEQCRALEAKGARDPGGLGEVVPEWDNFADVGGLAAPTASPGLQD